MSNTVLILKFFLGEEQDLRDNIVGITVAKNGQDLIPAVSLKEGLYLTLDPD